jgi:hypothetical protein
MLSEVFSNPFSIFVVSPDPRPFPEIRSFFKMAAAEKAIY